MYHCHKSLWIGKAHQLGPQHLVNTNTVITPILVFHSLWGIPPSRAWLRETSSGFQALLDTGRTFPLTAREMLRSHGHTLRGAQHVCVSLKLNSTPQLRSYTQTTASCKVFIRHGSPYNKINLQNMLQNHVLKAASSLHWLELDLGQLDLGQTALVHTSSAWVSWRALQAGEAENVCICVLVLYLGCVLLCCQKPRVMFLTTVRTGLNQEKSSERQRNSDELLMNKPH